MFWGVRQLAIVGLHTYNPPHRNIFLAAWYFDGALSVPGVDWVATSDLNEPG